jgi:hypothetical protein
LLDKSFRFRPDDLRNNSAMIRILLFVAAAATFLRRDAKPEEYLAELMVRANTGLGAQKAVLK